MQTARTVPATHVEPVVDELHGRQVVDPYRWLEDAESPRTIAWVEEQNQFTRSLLEAFPEREGIRRRLDELLSIGAVTAPVVRNGRFFYTRWDGRQNQPILYVRDGSEGDERVLLDPNQASDAGTVALDWWYPSWDGRLLAYGYSNNGDERSTMYVVDTDSGALLPDRIEHTRYASVAWLPDATGFYYTRYPAPGQVPAGEENYLKKVFFHALGADPGDDPLVFGEDLESEQMPSVSISRDGRYLAVSVNTGWSRSDIWVRDLSQTGSSFTPIAVGYDALFGASVVEDILYLHTNLDAPRYRVFQVDLQHPARETWQEIIPESQNVLQSMVLAGGRIVGEYLHNASSTLVIFEPDGSRLADVPLPTLGTITAITGQWDDLEAFYSFQSFTVPPSVYRLPLTGGASAVWASVDAPIQTNHYVVDQVWYPSRDGTRIPMFVVHARDIDRTRPHPTVLTGYGGFNIAETPIFRRSAFLLLEQGGVYAVANLRGGNEFGEDWHRDGMLDRKQNVFDDFIAAAEHLIGQGYTDSQHLAIEGGSNGGLLVGAALTQRPDLFRAVVCEVPLLDMLRYHHFQIARLWIPEYGSADDPDQFPNLYAYSPYHHVREGESYPAVLLMTADSDTRVDPMHARKMTAMLQAANASEHPILLRTETAAGHGIGKPRAKLVEEETDVWSFLFWQLGIGGPTL
jgi:prolyl oligopeptidase